MSDRFMTSYRAWYSRPEVVADFEGLSGLTPAEEFIFTRYLSQGMRILDVGVGCGRTTPFLASLAATYTGIDFSEPMIDVCRSKFPDREFLVMDASERWPFDDASFDAVVFSCNGLDCLYPDAKRWAFLKECNRALAPGGVFLFSVHNPLALFWRERYQAPDSHPIRLMVHGVRVWARVFRALFFSRAFWRKEGYFIDLYDRLPVHAATPAKVIRETSSAGFTFLERASDRYPRDPSKWTVLWNYFAFRKA
jgi:SAM-dependent methyltransferase